MRKAIIGLLVVGLLVTTVWRQTIVQGVETTNCGDGQVKPISLLEEYQGYKNVVGCLNSDGTKTVYLFSSAVDVPTIASVTGLSMETALEARTNGAFIDVLQDATVYSGSTNSNYGSQAYNEIGTTASRGVARTYIKFDLSILNNIRHSNNILSACFHLKTASETNTYSYVEAYLVKNSWTESGITWNNKPSYDTTEKLGTVILQKNQTDDNPNDLYLTKAVMAWKDGVANYGILLKEKDDNVYKKLVSSETPNHIDYFAVTYTDDSVTQAPGIRSGGTYYVINKNSGKYMTSASSSSGSNVYQSTGTGSQLQTWKITYMSSGYYTILLNGTSLCLQVAANSTANNANVQVETYTGAPEQQWQIERNWNGSYRLLPWSTNKKAVCVSSTALNDQANVYQYTYTPNYFYNDEWTLALTVKGTASIFCFDKNATNIDTTTGMNLLPSFINNAGFTTTIYKNQPASLGFQRLKRDSIYIFSSHGTESTIWFYENGGNSSCISTADSSSSSTYSLNSLSYNSLFNLRLLLLQTCYTGCNSGNTNLTGQAYRLGSQNIISNTCVTYVGPDQKWLFTFITNLGVSRNIGYAKERADEAVYEQFDGYAGGIPQRHELGDNSVYLFKYPSPKSAVQKSYEKSIKETQLTLDKTYMKYISTYCDTVTNKEYDLYSDNAGNLYTFYQNTNILQSYQPYVDKVLGKTIVNEQKAFAIAKQFLHDMDYDVSDFICDHSSQFSTNYRIVYQYKINGIDTNEKIVFYMQADEEGNPYITHFIADNYGNFSQRSNDKTTAFISSKKALQKLNEYKNSEEEIICVNKVFWGIDDENAPQLQAMVTVGSRNGGTIQIISL